MTYRTAAKTRLPKKALQKRAEQHHGGCYDHGGNDEAGQSKGNDRVRQGAPQIAAVSIYVAMAAANCHILEVSQGYMPMIWELFEEPFDIRPDGTVYAPEKPGLGFTLRPDALEKFKYLPGPEYEW